MLMINPKDNLHLDKEGHLNSSIYSTNPPNIILIQPLYNNIV